MDASSTESHSSSLNTIRLRGGQLFSVDDLVTSTELLDQHKEVLDTPSRSNTLPQRSL